MRRVRQSRTPATRYAMPVSHSHQLLCVSRSPLTTTVSRFGFDGSVTSHTSCAVFPKLRSRYTLLLSARGNVLPSHTRTICAPPCSACPGSPGMCATYLGCFGLVTSRIDVPLASAFPVRLLIVEPPWWPIYAIHRSPCLCT